MAGHNTYRERDRRRNPRGYDYDINKRDKYRDKYESRHGNERSRSPRRNRFHQHDDKKSRKSDDRRYSERPKDTRYDKNHAEKFSFDNVRFKKDPSPEWGKSNAKDADNKSVKPEEKDKPNFGLSGKLTEDANTVNGVVIKYAEPDDARKPKRRWRLYPFKGEKALPLLYVHRQSAYLMGRDRKIADIPLDHPSCSKQHAALQYRLVSFTKEGGGEGKRIRPYLIDLDSANGTFINNVKLEPRRFHELLERDVMKFGFSTREYVLLHEHSKDDQLDDDVAVSNET